MAHFPHALAEVLGRQVKHREGHPAADIHAHGVGNHGVVGGQHPADGQAVAVVGVGHERAGHGHGQLHGRFHLVHRPGVDVLGAEGGVGLARHQLNVPRHGG